MSSFKRLTKHPKFAPKQEIRPQKVSITDLITYHAKKANFDSQTALKIAKCESQLGKYRENWENSGAIGLFQFKPRTIRLSKGNLI